MHLKIAFCISAVVVAFVVVSAIGGKLPYEVAMTGLLAVLTYWSMPPRMTGSEPLKDIQIEHKESDGDCI
jgi:hypothetical protein